MVWDARKCIEQDFEIMALIAENRRHGWTRSQAIRFELLHFNEFMRRALRAR